jgi:hypothetical protein
MNNEGEIDAQDAQRDTKRIIQSNLQQLRPAAVAPLYA